ncbi:MAG: Ig-like domain-containing protein [Alistipes sp.]|nr:Ig-like domain-containing protein [Alistipes sp.]
MRKILCCMLLSFTLFACSKDVSDPEPEPKFDVNTKSVSLYSGVEHFITTVNGTNVTFESDNPYIATVNKTSGKVTAMTIGTTMIRVRSDQGNASVMVTVNPMYNTYKEPYRKFHMNKSMILANCGTPDSETSNVLLYYYSSLDTHVADMYQFENDFLSCSAALINQDAATETMKFLLERYWPAGTQDGMYMFVNGASRETVTMGVTLTKMSGYKLYIVTYMPFTFTKYDTRSYYNELYVEDIIKNFDEELLEQYKE